MSNEPSDSSHNNGNIFVENTMITNGLEGELNFVTNMTLNDIINYINIDLFNLIRYELGQEISDLEINIDREFEQVLNYSFENDIIPKEEINHELILRSRRYKAIKNKYPDEVKCSICLEDYVDDDRIVINLQCKHLFHKSCIKEWGKQSINCPICRNKMDVKTVQSK